MNGRDHSKQNSVSLGHVFNLKKKTFFSFCRNLPRIKKWPTIRIPNTTWNLNAINYPKSELVWYSSLHCIRNFWKPCFLSLECKWFSIKMVGLCALSYVLDRPFIQIMNQYIKILRISINHFKTVNTVQILVNFTVSCVDIGPFSLPFPKTVLISRSIR